MANRTDGEVDASRRWLLRTLTALGSAVVGTGLLGRAAAAAEKSTATAAPGTQPSFMDEAFRMRDEAAARGDQPFGAVVVKDGRIVGFGPSRVVIDQDPTAHAEMEAIRDAAKRLGTRDLSGATIYASSHPCRMCETGAYWANISRMIHGRGAVDAGAPRYSSC